MPLRAMDGQKHNSAWTVPREESMSGTSLLKPEGAEATIESCFSHRRRVHRWAMKCVMNTCVMLREGSN